MRYDFPIPEYIGSLLAETKDGKLTITHYSDSGCESVDVTYDMDWNFEKAREVAAELETLREQLEHLASIHDELTDVETAKQRLSREEFAVWQTYVAPFAPFEADMEEIFALQMTDEALTPEQDALLERYYQWYEEQCLQRLPYNRCSPVKLINRARRYEKLVSLHAPKVVVENEAYCFAQEMVLYYCRAV